MGVAADGEHKPTYQQGYELLGKYTIFAEGCRGNLGKQLIKKFDLDRESATQHYAIGLKELWDLDPEKHVPGKVDPRDGLAAAIICPVDSPAASCTTSRTPRRSSV